MRRHNDPVISIVVICVVLAVAAISYFVGNIRRRKRTEALQRLADELGLAFSPQDNDQLITELGWCDLFSRGRAKKILNLMSGSSGGRYVAAFDSQYVTGHGKGKKTWRTTVALLRSDGPSIPRFSLRPKGTWDKLSNWFKNADIDFENRQQFSRAYVLRGENEPAIRALFTEPVLEYFEQHPGLNAEGMDHTLLFYRTGKCVPPADVSQFMADAFAAQSLFDAAPQGNSRS
jgi:carbonic anhydrase